MNDEIEVKDIFGCYTFVKIDNLVDAVIDYYMADDDE